MRLHSFIRSLFIFSSAFLLASLPSCVGYQLGNTKPENLKRIETIYVPMIEDTTLEIKLAPQATNEIIKAISKDGTFRISRSSNADATLSAVIKTINYQISMAYQIKHSTVPINIR